MKIQIIKPYHYCPDGMKTITASVGEQELDDRWAKKALASGHAKEIKAAPSNKAKAARKTKAK